MSKTYMLTGAIIALAVLGIFYTASVERLDRKIDRLEHKVDSLHKKVTDWVGNNADTANRNAEVTQAQLNAIINTTALYFEYLTNLKSGDSFKESMKVSIQNHVNSALVKYDEENKK